jgi:hypothetical protein
MIVAFIPLHILFVLMSAFEFYIVHRSCSAFKFEFNSNMFESIKRYEKRKMLSYFPTRLGLKPSRPGQPFLSPLSRAQPDSPHPPFQQTDPAVAPLANQYRVEHLGKNSTPSSSQRGFSPFRFEWDSS